MYANGLRLKSEDTFKYSLLFCHACLTPNRTLTMVGDYVDIYLKICDNVRMDVTSQAALCWECMSMLRKILAFRIKVQNAQQILNYCVKNKAPVQGLTTLTQCGTETTTYPKDELDEDQSNASEDDNEELMIQIHDVKGHYDLTLDSSSDCDDTVEVEEEMRREEERRREEEDYRCWKRTVVLILKRICSHQFAPHFLKPVSDEYAPLYSKIVRRPTDLSTIKKRIKDGTIRTTEQLKRELLLMFSNAFMYNSSHHGIFKMALELRAETLRELSLLSASQSDSPQPPPLRPRRASSIRDLSLLSAESPQPPPLRRRRASTCAVCDDDVTVASTNGESNPVPDPPAATVRRRRRSEWSQPTPTPTPTTAATTAGPRRRSSAWNWTTLELDTEFLEPRHFGKIFKAAL